MTVVSPLSDNLRQSSEVAGIIDILSLFAERCLEILDVVLFSVLQVVIVYGLWILPTTLELECRDFSLPLGCSGTPECPWCYTLDSE